MSELGSDEQIVGEENPCQKLCGGFTMMCVGIVAFPLALFLLGWNENHFVCEDARILYAESNAVEVPTCSSVGNDGKFVFFSCPLAASTLKSFTPCTSATSSFGVPCSLPSTVSFSSVSGKQTVEMYQCTESCSTSERKNKMGQNTKVKTCSYSMQWTTDNWNSKSFTSGYGPGPSDCPDMQMAHGNPQPPANLALGVKTEFATGVVAGSVSTGFKLDDYLVHQLEPDTPVDLPQWGGTSASMMNPWQRPLTVTSPSLIYTNGYLSTCLVARLGCVRIMYYKSTVMSPTVITKSSSGGQTGPQTIPGGWGCSAQPWQTIMPEALSKADAIKALQDNNQTSLWLLRVAGLLAAWLAVYCCFQPISAAADVVGDGLNYLPCGGYLEDFLEGVVGTILCCMSCGIGVSCGLIVIALVWLFMRPLYGAMMLAIAIGLCVCVGVVRSQTTGKKNGRKVSEADDALVTESGSDDEP